jgi:hypothetical protein
MIEFCTLECQPFHDFELIIMKICSQCRSWKVDIDRACHLNKATLFWSYESKINLHTSLLALAANYGASISYSYIEVQLSSGVQIVSSG